MRDYITAAVPTPYSTRQTRMLALYMADAEGIKIFSHGVRLPYSSKPKYYWNHTVREAAAPSTPRFLSFDKGCHQC